jgi:hypothetical protein
MSSSSIELIDDPAGRRSRRVDGVVVQMRSSSSVLDEVPRRPGRAGVHPRRKPAGIDGCKVIGMAHSPNSKAVIARFSLGLAFGIIDRSRNLLGRRSLTAPTLKSWLGR